MSLREIYDDMRVTRAEALDMGLTHEARLYGIPCWAKNPSDQTFAAVPKFIPMRHALDLFDLMLDTLCWLLPPGGVLLMPVSHISPIIDEHAII